MKKKLLIFAFFLFTSLSSFAQLNKGLIAHYPFDGNANDVSGNSINPVVNKAIPAADRFGNPNRAYQFSGDSNTYIEIGHDAKLNLSGSKAISFWHRIDTIPNTPFPGLIYKEGPKFSFPTFGLQLNHDNGYALKDKFKVGFWFGNSSTNKLLSVKKSYLDTPYMKNWVHIVATYSKNSGVQKIYFNGVLSDSVIIGSYTADVSLKNMQIGRSSSANFSANHYKGFIDDIRIYDRAVTDIEVDSLFNRPNPTLSVRTPNVLYATKIYPNPASSQITITNIIEKTSLRIFDVTGKLIVSQNLSFDTNTTDISRLSKGVYIVLLNTEQHTKTHKLIVE